jgi:hypothetical protein
MVKSMKNWTRRLKAVATLGVIGAGVWAGAGVAVDLLVAVLTGSTTSFSSLMTSVGLGATFGALSAGGFAAVLTLTRQGKSLVELSTPGAALVGCVIGAVFPFLQMLVGGPLVASGSALLWVIGVCSFLGAGLTSSMVMIAKRSHAAELRATHTQSLSSTSESQGS